MKIDGILTQKKLYFHCFQTCLSDAVMFFSFMCVLSVQFSTFLILYQGMTVILIEIKEYLIIIIHI